MRWQSLDALIQSEPSFVRVERNRFSRRVARWNLALGWKHLRYIRLEGFRYLVGEGEAGVRASIFNSIDIAVGNTEEFRQIASRPEPFPPKSAHIVLHEDVSFAGVVPARRGSFERLIFSEVGDAQSQRVDRDEFVRYVGLKNEDKVRGIKIALQLAMVGVRII